MNICSVDNTVPKYSRCLFAAVKGIPHSNGIFYSVCFSIQGRLLDR